jgi:hypothetical protein
MTDRHRDEPVDPLRMEPGDDPRESRTPVVADDVSAPDVERVEDRDDVCGALRDAIRLDLARLVGLPETAQVWHDHAMSGRDERRHLVAPQRG